MMPYIQIVKAHNDCNEIKFAIKFHVENGVVEQSGMVY
jgi:hypothetical protein